MAKSLEQIMADMAAQGITINVKLAPGARDGNSPSELIRDAAKAQGNYYGDETPAPVPESTHPKGQNDD